MVSRLFRFLLSGALVVVIAACSGEGVQPNTQDDYNRPDRQSTMDRQGTLFGGDEGLTLFNTRRGDSDAGTGGTGLGVNAYLWRASLDTLSFMPLVSADPFGGVIITDWYTPQGGNERFKATAYILGRQLRADGVRISLFRQVRQGNAWVDSPVSPNIQAELEDKVLARARELRTQATR